MNISRPYRVVAFVLALVFALFNIGLPVVLSSCPMPGGATKGACALCRTMERPGTETLTRSIDKSCCLTVLAAERNTNEFLHLRSIADDAAFFAVAVIAQMPASETVTRHSARIMGVATACLLPSQDIPIVTSSLLI